ncbi:MAG: MFS transporter, partial [Nostocoides sp.]
ASTILFICFVGPALLVTPLWQRVGERSGKSIGYAAASACLGFGAVATYLLRSTSVGVIALAVALVGIGYAGCQLFPLAMLPDVAAADAERSGENRIGVFTGVWTAGETLGLAFGPGLYAAVLAFGGYVASTDGTAPQTAGAVHAVAIGFGIVPAAFIALSAWPLLAYRRREPTRSEANP